MREKKRERQGDKEKGKRESNCGRMFDSLRDNDRKKMMKRQRESDAMRE